MIHSAKRLSGILLENGCDKTSLPFARTRKKLSYIAGLFSSAQVPNMRSKGISDFSTPVTS